MSSEELTEWQLYERLAGPLGHRRGDIQAATISSTIANVMKIKGKNAKISDFLIPYDRITAYKSPRDLLNTVKRLNASYGGTKGG